MDYMRNNGVYLDQNVLQAIANNILNDARGGYYNNPTAQINDYNTLNRMGRMQRGYYDLRQVPVGGMGNVNLWDIIRRYNGY